MEGEKEMAFAASFSLLADRMFREKPSAGRWPFNSQAGAS
jgi:hypothetical protein